MWITPYSQHTDFPEPRTVDDKIQIFEEQTLGWLLDIAGAAIDGTAAFNGTKLGGPILHSGYVVTQMVLVYFELIAKMKDGYLETRRSEPYFREGVLDVYPQLSTSAQAAKDVLTTLYRSGRCGLYHAGRTAGRITLSGQPTEALTYDALRRRITINPHKLVPDLKAHFSQYIADLRDPAHVDLRANFESRFDYLQAFDPFAKYQGR